MLELEFETLVQKRIDRIKELIDDKGVEYARDHDRLHNFREAGLINKTSMPKALHGMLTKHLVSYLDWIKVPRVGLSRQQIQERFGDIIIYFVLQEILFLAEYNLTDNENEKDTFDSPLPF